MASAAAAAEEPQQEAAGTTRHGLLAARAQTRRDQREASRRALQASIHAAVEIGLARAGRVWVASLMFLVLGMVGVLIWSEMVYDRHYRDNCDEDLVQLLQALYLIVALNVFHREIVRNILCFDPSTGARPPCRVWLFRRALLFLGLIWPFVGLYMVDMARNCSHELEKAVWVLIIYYAIIALVAVILPACFISVLVCLIRRGVISAPRSRNAAPENFVDTLQKVPYDAARFNDDADGAFCTSCPICLEAFADDVEQSISVSPCTAGMHAFHTECLRGWLQCARTCPLCRQDLTDTSMRDSDVEISNVATPF